jgi:hypothetical protein
MIYRSVVSKHFVVNSCKEWLLKKVGKEDSLVLGAPGGDRSQRIHHIQITNGG